MMRELLWGHVTMHCTKFCPRALVVLEARHVEGLMPSAPPSEQ